MRNSAGLIVGVSGQEEERTQSHLLDIHTNKEMGHSLREETASGIAVISIYDCKKRKRPIEEYDGTYDEGGWSITQVYRYLYTTYARKNAATANPETTGLMIAYDIPKCES